MNNAAKGKMLSRDVEEDGRECDDIICIVAHLKVK